MLCTFVLDSFQVMLQVSFLGRFAFYFWALAWFSPWALAKNPQEAPKRPTGGPPRSPKRSEL